MSAVPLHFGPSGSSLFGWFHPAEGAARAVGVVLANPIGDDLTRAHRALRHLAERLARAGFAVVRFDFHGTGDSSGSEADPERVKTWLRDLGLAVDEVKSRGAVERVVVLGIKLGATLAAVAAAKRPVDGLVLWAAYPTGAGFVKEATQLHRMHQLLEPQSFAAQPSGWQSGGQEALGFLLTDETMRDLSELDLGKLTARPAARALVVGTLNVPQEDKLRAALSALGTEVEYRHVPGQKFLSQPPHRAELPAVALDEIVAWIESRWPRDAAAQKNSPDAAAQKNSAHKISAGANKADAPYGERPLVFGEDRPRFGILVEPPPSARGTKRPAIILTNAGCIHRVGPHRLYVTMARAWAARGFYVLRLDLSGIGDSPTAPGAVENAPYPASARADFAAATAALARETGADRFIVAGHGSGGDLAFQAATQDGRVVGAVLINPRTFCVYDAATVDQYKRARYYQSSILRPESWKKALRGDVDLRRALGMVVPKFADLAKQRLKAFWPGRSANRETGGDDVPATLRGLVERGVDLLLIATENDPGVDYVDVRFGDAMSRLASVHGFRREDLHGTDHTFTSRYVQEKVAQLVTEHVAARHGA